LNEIGKLLISVDIVSGAGEGALQLSYVLFEATWRGSKETWGKTVSGASKEL